MLPLCFIQMFSFGILMSKYVDQITRTTGTSLLQNNAVVHAQLMLVILIIIRCPSKN